MLNFALETQEISTLTKIGSVEAPKCEVSYYLGSIIYKEKFPLRLCINKSL